MPFELELKAGLSQADAQAAARQLDERWGPGSEPEALHARYFDSADDRLAGAGIALRIRTEGGGLVQAVKAGRRSVGGFHQVRELEAMVPGWDVSPEAISEAGLREAVERTALQVRFETRVDRRRWVVQHKHGIVEAALDLGEIRAGQAAIPVCELEFELLEGSPEAVFELARDLLGKVPALLTLPSKAARGKALANGRVWVPKISGAKPVVAAPGEAADSSWGRALSTLAPAIGGNLFLLFTQEDPEGPHQLRVALRRLRAALKLHRPLLDKKLAMALAGQAQKLGRMVAPLRDCDVLLESLRARANPGPELEAALVTHRAALRAQALGDLRAADATGFALTLLGLAAIGGWKPARPVPPQTIDELGALALHRLWRKVRALGDRLSTLEDEQRHEFRKSLKKFRYLLELSPKIFASKEFMSRLKKLQEELGFLNDISVLMAWNPPLVGDLERQFAEVRGELEKGMSQRADLALGRACRHWRDLRKLALPLAPPAP